MRLKPQIVYLIKEFSEAFFAQKLRTKKMNNFFFKQTEYCDTKRFFYQDKSRNINIYLII